MGVFQRTAIMIDFDQFERNAPGLGCRTIIAKAVEAGVGVSVEDQGRPFINLRFDPWEPPTQSDGKDSRSQKKILDAERCSSSAFPDCENRGKVLIVGAKRWKRFSQ
jgi:hypothetical protein